MGFQAKGIDAVTGAGELALREIARLTLSSESTTQLIVTLATICEAHVAEVLEALVEDARAGSSSFSEATFKRIEDGMYSSWRSMHEWLKDGFGLQIAGRATTERLGDLVDLRNAIVHGNHRLSRNQTKTTIAAIKTSRKLARALDVQFDGISIIFGKETRTQALSIVRAFILDFDATVVSSYPQLSSIGNNSALKVPAR